MANNWTDFWVKNRISSCRSIANGIIELLGCWSSDQWQLCLHFNRYTHNHFIVNVTTFLLGVCTENYAVLEKNISGKDSPRWKNRSQFALSCAVINCKVDIQFMRHQTYSQEDCVQGERAYRKIGGYHWFPNSQKFASLHCRDFILNIHLLTFFSCQSEKKLMNARW